MQNRFPTGIKQFINTLADPEFSGSQLGEYCGQDHPHSRTRVYVNPVLGKDVKDPAAVRD